MNKTEIQDRIQKCESREAYLQREHDALKSELASLKADLEKCDCADGIEQEKCWYARDSNGNVEFTSACIRKDYKNYSSHIYRPAYMPECRQLTAEDVARIPCFIPVQHEEMARELHKLGFRMKVNP